MGTAWEALYNVLSQPILFPPTLFDSIDGTRIYDQPYGLIN